VRCIIMVSLWCTEIGMRIHHLALMVRSSRICCFPVRIPVFRHDVLLVRRYSSAIAAMTTGITDRRPARYSWKRVHTARFATATWDPIVLLVMISATRI